MSSSSVRHNGKSLTQPPIIIIIIMILLLYSRAHDT
jgi:hypothetical protein